MNSLKDEVKVYDTFDNIADEGLSEDVLRGIYSMGFTEPSYIQQRGIVPIMKGRDVMGQAQSGTGKTATFCIGALSRIDPEILSPQVIILNHTRELAQQNCDVITQIGSYITYRDGDGNQHEGIKTTLCIGGIDVGQNVASLKQGCHCVVGTPGRVRDLANRNALNLRDVRLIILDEADQMLSEEFQSQVYDIYKEMDKGVQFCIFSATYPTDIEELAGEILNNPVRIMVPKEQLSLDGIHQYYVYVEDARNKYSTLVDLFRVMPHSQTIIYVGSKERCEELVDHLRTDDNYPVAGIHSNMTQEVRSKILNDFKRGSDIRVLVSTDLLARGIDVQQISMVINYDMTRNRENYLHRIGRSGRFGRQGVAINFVTKSDQRIMHDLETHYKINIEELPSDFQQRL